MRDDFRSKLPKLFPEVTEMSEGAAETPFFLEQAVARYSIGQLATMLGRNPKTITRWRAGETASPP